MSNAVQKIEPEAMTELVDQAPSRSAAPITPMEMLQIAVEKGADLDQLQKLMDLQERWEANEARKAFVVAKAKFKAKAPAIDKNKHVGFTSKKEGASKTDYWHATLDHVAELLDPVLSKYGLSYSWETEQRDGGLIRVTCILTHVMGHSERVTLQATPDTSGNKNSIQAVGSTVTYLQRYTLLSATGISTGDMDDDGKAAGGGQITEGQLTELRAELDAVEADIPGFCKYMGVESLKDIPQSQLGKARNAIAAKKGKSK